MKARILFVAVSLVSFAAAGWIVFASTTQANDQEAVGARPTLAA